MTQSDFLAIIKDSFNNLTNQQKVIAQFIEQNANRIALLKIKELADACNVQPSAIVRFAKRFGLNGYIPMQQLFITHASEQISPRVEYQKRIADWTIKENGKLMPSQIAQTFIYGCQIGLQELIVNIDEEALSKAIKNLQNAPRIWVVAMRRSFAVGAYLVYGLQNLHKNTVWLNGLGGMNNGNFELAGPRDWLVVVSFSPYAEETLALAQKAHERGVSILAITDSNISILAQMAQITLLTQEHSTFNFRSLSNSMCLAQGLIVGMAQYELMHE